jgi:hypothetical protein
VRWNQSIKTTAEKNSGNGLTVEVAIAFVLGSVSKGPFFAPGRSHDQSAVTLINLTTIERCLIELLERMISTTSVTGSDRL